MKYVLSILIVLAFTSCIDPEVEKVPVKYASALATNVDSSLPTVGVLIFDGFLSNEIVAPLDVFTKHNVDGKKLFNVVLIAKEQRSYRSEEGMKILPDVTIHDAPKLSVLVVPSSYHTERQMEDKELMSFIRERGEKADYVASHCAGAFLLGKSGLANQKKLVTYVGGGTALQQQFPEVIAMNDLEHRVVTDGKLISSNGSLVSYLGAFELLEKMTNTKHRKHVEDGLLWDRIVQ